MVLACNWVDPSRLVVTVYGQYCYQWNRLGVVNGYLRLREFGSTSRARDDIWAIWSL